jgi:predicted transcriptional regulator
MTRNPYSIPENEDIKNVLREMNSRKIGSAIITDDGGNISGIFTTLDAINLLGNLI